MNTRWYYKLMGEIIGPLSETQLRQHVAELKVTRETHLRRNDDNRWITADSVTGLFDAQSTHLDESEDNAPKTTPSTIASKSEDSEKKLDQNQTLGCIGIIVACLFVALLIGRCNSSGHEAPLTPDEQRASDVFQDRLGADPDDADRAARKLRQMLERDRKRGR